VRWRIVFFVQYRAAHWFFAKIRQQVLGAGIRQATPTYNRSFSSRVLACTFLRDLVWPVFGMGLCSENSLRITPALAARDFSRQIAPQPTCASVPFSSVCFSASDPDVGSRRARKIEKRVRAALLFPGHGCTRKCVHRGVRDSSWFSSTPDSLRAHQGQTPQTEAASWIFVVRKIGWLWAIHAQIARAQGRRGG